MADQDEAIQARLAEIRRAIDALDDQLLVLLEQRARAVAEAWRLKSAQGLAVHDPARERAILDRLRRDARELDPELVEHVFRRIVGVAAPDPESAAAGAGCRPDESAPSSAPPEPEPGR